MRRTLRHNTNTVRLIVGTPIVTVLLLGGCQEWLATSDPAVHVGETETVTCVGCHKPDYNVAKSPDHVGAKLSTACETCHTKVSWHPAKWDHQTWPLTGKHIEATCAQCHKAAPDRVNKPPRTCDGCHMPDYAATTAPNHSANQYPNTCQDCHTTAAWKPAKFDHKTWPLVGKHQQATCAGCHSTAPNRIVKPPRDCDGCHLPDYNAAKSPDHQAGSYPKTCQSCHTPAGWQPAGMADHAFPITSGKHTNIACATCHTNPDDFKVFSCMSSGCHPKNQMDNKHLGEVSGYVYKASACLSCHPNGKE